MTRPREPDDQDLESVVYIERVQQTYLHALGNRLPTVLASKASAVGVEEAGFFGPASAGAAGAGFGGGGLIALALRSVRIFFRSMWPASMVLEITRAAATVTSDESNPA